MEFSKAIFCRHFLWSDLRDFVRDMFPFVDFRERQEIFQDDHVFLGELRDINRWVSRNVCGRCSIHSPWTGADRVCLCLMISTLRVNLELGSIGIVQTVLLYVIEAILSRWWSRCSRAVTLSIDMVIYSRVWWVSVVMKRVYRCRRVCWACNALTLMMSQRLSRDRGLPYLMVIWIICIWYAGSLVQREWMCIFRGI